MMFLELFAGPVAALLMLALAYSLILGNFTSKFTRLFFRWVIIVIIVTTLLRMFIPH